MKNEGLNSRARNLRSKSVLDMSHTGARKFFLKPKSYCNIELPSYFIFNNMLSKLNIILKGKKISDFVTAKAKARDNTKVNYCLINNKDGKYAWRELQLIHPALYVSLVHEITDKNNWNTIRKRFKIFSNNKKVECISLPREGMKNNNDKAEQILSWWQDVEQKSIELALEYDHLIHADISDCYSSIYTHSIAWALHGKIVAKKKDNRKSSKFIGNVIDNCIQDFSNGQTNGIPQGSILMDFIAEIVLGYMDLELSERIDGKHNNYHIIRYRDDYRIFVNDPHEGEMILKNLSEVALGMGLKLNPSKTKISTQVIIDAIKEDKIFWMKQVQKNKNLQKQLLIIHTLSKDFPNSGSLDIALHRYHRLILKKKSISEDLLLPLISITTDITCHNPRSYAVLSAILSKFISLFKNNAVKLEIVKKIRGKFKAIPNTGYLEIWLQRMTLSFDKDIRYNELLCRIVSGEIEKLWNSDWLSNKIQKCTDAKNIIDVKKINKLLPVISNDEIEIFRSRYY